MDLYNAQYWYNYGNGAWSSSLPSYDTLHENLEYIKILFDWVDANPSLAGESVIWSSSRENGSSGRGIVLQYSGIFVTKVWTKGYADSLNTTRKRVNIDSL